MLRVYSQLVDAVKRTAWIGLCLLLAGSGDLQERLDRSRQLEAELAQLTAMFEEGRVEEALRRMDVGLSEDALTPRLWNLRGLLLAAVDRDREAVGAYEQGIRGDPSRPELHQNLAISLVRLGATGRALAEFEQALELDPRALEARLGLGRELLRLRRPAAARPHLEAAFAQAPRDARVVRALAEVFDAGADPGQALRWWRELEALRPDADAARRIGELSRREDPMGAIEAFDRCAERDSTASDCLQAAAALLLEAEQPSEARRRLEEAERRSALDPSAEYNLLLALERSGDHAALERRLEDRPPLSGAAWGVVALSRRQRGDTPGALSAARQGVGLAPDDPTLQNLLGVLLAENGRVEEARGVWRDILRIHPGHREAEANLRAYGGD